MKQKGPKVLKKVRRISPKKYVSNGIHIDITGLEEPLHKAEIVIQALNGSGFSYEGRIFLNNPNANHETEPSLKYGYVGSYHILGYGGFPSVDAFYIKRSRFDYRPSQSPVIPYKRIVVTDALRTLGAHSQKFTITIVPILPSGNNNRSIITNENIIQFDKIGIIIR
jgi:hypothetical protein